MNTCDKFFWVVNHTGFGVPGAQATIKMTPQMVNPFNSEINLITPELNTKLEWWIEVNKLDSIGDDLQTHFYELDCGGNTAEEAIDKLYELVLEKYGTY